MLHLSIYKTKQLVPIFVAFFFTSVIGPNSHVQSQKPKGSCGVQVLSCITAFYIARIIIYFKLIMIRSDHKTLIHDEAKQII